MPPFGFLNNEDSTDYPHDDDMYYDDEGNMVHATNSFDPYSGTYSEPQPLPARRFYDNSRPGPKWTSDELLDTYLAIVHSNTPKELIANLKKLLRR